MYDRRTTFKAQIYMVAAELESNKAQRRNGTVTVTLDIHESFVCITVYMLNMPSIVVLDLPDRDESLLIAS